MTKIKIKKWIIFTKFGRNVEPFLFDSSKLNVTDEEISKNIEEQIFGDIK